MPDPRLQGVYRDFVPSGVGSKSFLLALDGWKRQFAEMNTALASSDWLVGNELTLSDLAYLPYMCRIEHLHMRFGPAAQPWRAGSIVARRPRYREGIKAWLNPKYLELGAPVARSSVERAPQNPFMSIWPIVAGDLKLAFWASSREEVVSPLPLR